MRRSKTKKVTVNLPEDLLEQAKDASKKGVTATIKHGLQLVAASEAYKKLRSLKGKVRFSIDLNNLRED